MNDRRSELRFMCADLVTVRIQDAAGAREMAANLEDISPSGACVQLQAAALKGADVEMICAKCRWKGKISYCRFGELGYDVGIAFEERCSWNSQRFMPKHLLEVRTRCAGSS